MGHRYICWSFSICSQFYPFYLSGTGSLWRMIQEGKWPQRIAQHFGGFGFSRKEGGCWELLCTTGLGENCINGWQGSKDPQFMKRKYVLWMCSMWPNGLYRSHGDWLTSKTFGPLDWTGPLFPVWLRENGLSSFMESPEPPKLGGLHPAP